MSEMNEIGEYTDDQVEAILTGDDAAGEEFALAAFISEARLIGTKPVDADLMRRQVPMLAEAARLVSAYAPSGRGDETDLGPQVITTSTFTSRRRRLVTKAAVIGLAAVLMGGTVASAATGNLPASLQDAVTDLAARVGIDLPHSAGGALDKTLAELTSSDASPPKAAEIDPSDGMFTTSVRDTIDEYLGALTAWTACVAGNASGRGAAQGDPATRVAGPFDPTAGCDPQPKLDMSDPTSSDAAGRQDETGPAGPPDNQPTGPPETAGPPADQPTGPPESAGPPADQPTGPPQDGGPPAGPP